MEKVGVILWTSLEVKGVDLMDNVYRGISGILTDTERTVKDQVELFISDCHNNVMDTTKNDELWN